MLNFLRKHATKKELLEDTKFFALLNKAKNANA